MKQIPGSYKFFSEKYSILFVAIFLSAVLSLVFIILGINYISKKPITPSQNAIDISEQERRLRQAFKNEIECSEQFSEINKLPLNAIKQEIKRRGFLAGFSNNDVPFFNKISFAYCFDLNKNGKEEVLLAIKITNLSNQKDNHIIERVNAGAPEIEYTLLVLMENTFDNFPSEEKWNILWSSEVNHTLKSDIGKLAVEDGKQENSIKIGNFYLTLDGEIPRLDINGEFKDINVNEKKFGNSPGTESNFGDYYTETVFMETAKQDYTFISATRLWKKEDDKYKFITDIPTGHGEIDLMLLSSFVSEEGNDVLYMRNVPNDTFCSAGLTKFDTRNNVSYFPEFSKSYKSCNASISPDGKKVITVDAYSIQLHDLFNERRTFIEDRNAATMITANKIRGGGRDFKGNYGWMDNETFFCDMFKELREGAENEYIETKIWKIDQNRLVY